MVCHQIFAGLREQALLSWADSLCHLLFAGREPEISRGASHIVDIALEIRLLRQKLASSRMDSWLLTWTIRPWWKVRAQKLQPPKAAPVADEAELHLTDGRNASLGLIGRMGRPHIGKGVTSSISSVERGFAGGFWTT